MTDGIPLFSASHPRAPSWRRVWFRLFGPRDISKKALDIVEIEIADHLNIVGYGLTRQEAALNFLEDLRIKFPCQSGSFNVFLRVPLEYDFQIDYASGEKMHRYYMRLSYWNFIKPSGINYVGFRE